MVYSLDAYTHLVPMLSDISNLGTPSNSHEFDQLPIPHHKVVLASDTDRRKLDDEEFSALPHVSPEFHWLVRDVIRMC